MNKNEVLKEAARIFYRLQIIPEATAEEKEYNKNIFVLKGIPEKYPDFYNKCMVERYEIYKNSWDVEYINPTTFYTISQLEKYIEIEKAIEEANNNCNFEEADNLYIIEENYINSITPPAIYTS